jgi:hypothetical protein
MSFQFGYFAFRGRKFLRKLTGVSYRKMATLRGILRPEILQGILSLGLLKKTRVGDEVSLGFFSH